MFAVWRQSDGALVCIATTLATPFPAGLGTADVGGTEPTGVWSPVTLTFSPAPTIKATPTRKAFLARFAQAEREALQNILASGTQTQKNKLNAFLAYIGSDNVDLNDAYIQASINLMETASVIGVGRAAQIIG